MTVNAPIRRITPKKAMLILFDICAALVALLVACFVYFNGDIPTNIWDHVKNVWYIYMLTSGVVFYFSGLYDQMWAFASGMAYLSIVVGVSFQMLFVVMVSQLMGQRMQVPIYILYWFLLITAITAIRLLYRLTRNPGLMRLTKRTARGDNTIRVMIVGAGMAGSQVIVEMKTRQHLRVPILAVDDNPLTHTYKNNGVPVLGNRHDIPTLAKQYAIDEIVITMPSASAKSIRQIIDICHKTSCRVRILPFYSDLIEGKFSLADIRDVAIEDLLRREPADLEINKISSFLSGRTVLITGGGGSIGSEICRQIMPYKPKLVVAFDIYENNVYDLQQALIGRYGPNVPFVVQIGSIRDVTRLDQLMTTYAPDIVFHAAAHKHVPLMQFSRVDAVKNNVFGTWNVADAAGRHGVKKFVLISTDKAVNPTNVMGATKRIAEMAVLSLRGRYPETTFSAVRFGNVLGSSGSVIPLFKRQIEKEKRVTVTHPDIVRYFMTIPEAACLVLQAGAYAKGAEVFVLDMGKPVKMVDLARDLIRLSGYEPDVDIPIEFIGLRPGEKMFEELALDRETMRKTANDKIYVVDTVSDRAALREEARRLEAIIDAPDSGLESFLDTLFAKIQAH